MSTLKRKEDERRRKDMKLAAAGCTVATPTPPNPHRPLRIDPRKAELLAKARAERAAIPSNFGVGK